MKLVLNKDVAIVDLKEYGFGENGSPFGTIQRKEAGEFPDYSLEVNFETKELEFYVYGDFQIDSELLYTIYRLITEKVFVPVED